MTTSDELRVGDIVFTSSKKLMGRLIRWGERSIGEQVPDVNHAAVVVTGGSFDSAQIVEAERRVEYNNLRVSHGDDLVFGYRAKKLDDNARNRIAAFAFLRVGQGYGWAQLAAQLVDSKVFGGRTVVRNVVRVDHLPICSRLVAELYAAEGLTFGLPPYAADPDSMQRYCDSHPDEFELVLDYAPE